MALFTRENAREMSKRGNIARWTRARIPAPREEPTQGIAENERKQKTLEQIDKLDEMLARTRNPVLFVKLTMAKEKLWNLVFPKPGSLRPKQGRPERAPIAPLIPQPIASPSALVVPGDPENHNGEIVQS